MGNIVNTNTKFRVSKGLVANLPSTKTEGNLYVTTDERAIYVDVSSDSRIRISDVIWVNTKNDLPKITTAERAQSFAFVKDLKALCYWNGSAWQQINADLPLSALIDNETSGYTYSSNSNTANVHLSLIDKLDETGATDVLSGKNMVIKGTAGNTTVTADSNGVQIGSADTVKTTSATINQTNNSDITIQLAETTSGYGADGKAVTASTVNSNALQIKFAGANVTTGTANQVVGVNVIPESLALDFDSNGALSVSYTPADGSDAVTSVGIVPTITYGNSNSIAKFEGKNAKLDVYTKTEVDAVINKQLRTANAMVFVGSIDGVKTYLPVAEGSNNYVEVANGATYIFSGEDGTNVTYGTGKTVAARVGDLFIASGTENNDGYILKDSLVWNYVPAGNDDLYSTEATVTSKQFLLKQNLGDLWNNDIGSIVVGNGLTGSVGSNNDLTISHSTLTATKKTNDVNTFSIPVVQSLSFDAYGHVSGYTLGTFKVPNYELQGITYSVAGDVNNVIITGNYDRSEDTEPLQVAMPAFTTSSNSSLQISAAGNSVAFELVWGSFDTDN